MMLFVSFSLLQDLSCDTLSFFLCQEFLIFSINDLNRLSLQCFYFHLLPLRLLYNLLVKKINFFNIVVMLKCEHDLHVVSFQFQKLLSLVIVNSQQFVFLVFNLFLEFHIVICGGHQGNSHFTG